jgi:NAD+ synthase (glutamine-hydrolysing)
MKIAISQFNPVVGDVAGNARRMLAITEEAALEGAALVVFPELSLIGYSHHDLLDNDFIVSGMEDALVWLHQQMPAGLAIIVGTVVRNPSREGKKLFNAAAFMESGKPVQYVFKMLLPTYDIYDEYRYFEPATGQTPISFRGRKLGIHICEDMWNLERFSTYHLYERNPVAELVEQGADILINLSASPFSHGRHETRTDLIQEICREHRVPFVLSNQVGANTELIFDGDSRVHNADGQIVVCAPSFEEALIYWDTTGTSVCTLEPHDRIGDIHDALVCGITEYVSKTGVFNKLLIGLSGGIDSAVTAALAVESVGADRVMGITMPSEYSSAGSISDSVELAENLGIPCHTIAIKEGVSAFGTMLEPLFEGTTPGLAEENIQARVRGVTLMAVSNKFGHLVLTTGNKSEMAMGYATLYGDMSGGLAVLADVFKTDVYLLAEHINERAGREIIPVATITKAPSAELRPNQKDADSLPPYPVLDEVLRLYVEKRLDVDAICAETGFERSFVAELLAAVDRNEFKRRQAPPGLRVSSKAFGGGRRIPIVMKLDREAMEGIKQEIRTETRA